MKSTVVDGNRAFLETLDPSRAARELVDDRFVKQSIGALGGLAAFGLPNTFTREETIVV